MMDDIGITGIILVKVFGMLGLIYIVIGIRNVRKDCVVEIYESFWQMKYPNKEEIIRLGVNLILLEVIVDILINLF